MKSIKDYSDYGDWCTGCGSCYNKCPTDAIKMEENEEGFLYPSINSDKCINCGLCVESCPVKSQKPTENFFKPKCYAVMGNNEIRQDSSSGGVFTMAATYFLNKGGYVCGAAYDENYKVEHVLINNIDDLWKLKGSKYLQSDIKTCYKEIKSLLMAGEKVLFTGCPCQIAGLYSYLADSYDNLVTIELLCHGTPSYKIFKKYKFSG